MTATMVHGGMPRRGRRWDWLGPLVLGAVLMAACGGGGDDDGEAGATETTARRGPTTTSGPAGVLPNLCGLLTEEEVEAETGQPVGEVRELPTGCNYLGADGKQLVASVLAVRPGFVDFDDMKHTRGALESETVVGADDAIFLPDFFVTTALKGDVMASVQTPALRADGKVKVKRVTEALLEKVLSRV